MSKTLFSAAIVTALFMAVSNAQAQTPDVLTRLYKCKSIAEDAARLTCYDAQVGHVETAQQTGDLVAIDREAAEEIQRDSFGFNIPSLPKINLFNRANKDKSARRAKVEFADISLPLKSTRVMGNGKTRFYLENGQVWDQTQNASQRIPKLKKEGGNVLLIKKASMGSFMGRVNGKGAGIRMKRRE